MLHKEPRIVFRCFPPDIDRSVHPDEARILFDWLRTERNLSAESLKDRIAEALEAAEPPLITLTQDERGALLELLNGAEIGEFEGLCRLRNTLTGGLLSP